MHCLLSLTRTVGILLLMFEQTVCQDHYKYLISHILLTFTCNSNFNRGNLLCAQNSFLQCSKIIWLKNNDVVKTLLQRQNTPKVCLTKQTKVRVVYKMLQWFLSASLCVCVVSFLLALGVLPKRSKEMLWFSFSITSSVQFLSVWRKKCSEGGTTSQMDLGPCAHCLVEVEGKREA